MSDITKKDQYIFNGELYEKDIDGNNVKTINISNIESGNGIIIDKTTDKITINTDLGISIINGQLCVTYEKEVEV